MNTYFKMTFVSMMICSFFSQQIHAEEYAKIEVDKTVNLNKDVFYIAKHETTNAEVVKVYKWALNNDLVYIIDGTVCLLQNGITTRLLKCSDPDSRIKVVDDFKSTPGGETRMTASTIDVEEGYDDFPCVEITWYGAVAFCNFLSQMHGLSPVYDFDNWSASLQAEGYRLPGKGEWQYVAQSGVEADLSAADTAWNSKNADNHTHPVGQLSADKRGIFDLAGNVWEWTHTPYVAESITGDQRRVGGENSTINTVEVTRSSGVAPSVYILGGGFANDPARCSVTIEYKFQREFGDAGIGFRLCSYTTPIEGPAPGGFVRVAGGTFTMGDTWGNGSYCETPTHDVTVSSFQMAVTEVTNQQVADVFQWAYNNGKLTADSNTVKNANGNSRELLDLNDNDCQISFSDGTFSVDDGKEDHPVVEITWYGSAAYCNFLSEKEGLTPAYDFSDWNSCDWNANGYRLPTDAEWEYAARGGQADTDPGGDDDHEYAGSDANTSLDDVAWHDGNAGGHSHEVGTRAANELGIHDLSGNVWEWCWDWYDSGYYAESPATDPRGPGSGWSRVRRGGSWFYGAWNCRVSNRPGYRPDYSHNNNGFRPVLPAGQ